MIGGERWASEWLRVIVKCGGRRGDFHFGVSFAMRFRLILSSMSSIQVETTDHQVT